MPFTNRIRLPFYMSKPQFPVDEEIYLKANGTRVILKSITAKELQGTTDYMPAKLHERLVIALRHDSVNIESTKYTGGIKIAGAYEIEWQEFLDFPIAQAKFKALEEAFAARLTRCDVCPVVSMLNAVDDTMPDILEEGESYQIDVTTNDGICCTPIAFEIVSFDADYIDTISISAEGVVSFTLKTPLASAPDKTLFTYSVSCGEDTDTADVFGTVEGTLTPLCERPPTLEVSIVSPSSFPEEIHAEWTAPGSPPADGYGWVLLKKVGLGYSLVSSGETAGLSVNINGLDCDALYRFQVRSICDAEAGDYSGYKGKFISTPDCDTENLQMTIELFAYNVINGLNDEWHIEANIISPAGVELDEDFTASGTFSINGTGYPFSVTILANNGTADSGMIGIAVPNPSTAFIVEVFGSPASATGTDTNEYDLILTT